MILYIGYTCKTYILIEMEEVVFSSYPYNFSAHTVSIFRGIILLLMLLVIKNLYKEDIGTVI